MKKLTVSCLILLSIGLLAAASFAQSTEFAFQGRLTDSGVPVAVNYDLRFTLFSQSAGGAAIGTVERTDVPVSNGVFTVKLDFGGAAFDGSARWIETEVKPTGGGTYQPLNPRVFLTTVPYSVRSLTAANATQLGGIAATEFVQTTDPRMTDARPPAPGDGSYIQNTTAAQTASNFNITGTGKADIIEAATQFNINGERVLSSNGSNIFVGYLSGRDNTSGTANSFYGYGSGSFNTTGRDNSFYGIFSGLKNIGGNRNSFFGTQSGTNNIGGSLNSFFGYSSGNENTTGTSNSFFGSSAGLKNTTGSSNAFFGQNSGNNNIDGSRNSFFGFDSGRINQGGIQNVFIGSGTGSNNRFGSQNTYVGNDAGFGSDSDRNTLIGAVADLSFGITGSSAIGYRAFVTQSNSLVLGSINGQNGATVDTNVGIGTTAPSERFEVRDNAASMIVGGAFCPAGSITIGLNGAFGNCEAYSVRGDGLTLFLNRPTGGQIVFRENNGPTQLRLRSGGVLQLETLGTAGATPLCHNAAKDISTCSSSIRYKTNVNNFTSSLDLIKKLRPVSFNWTVGGMPDIGLVAEEVAEVEPLLTTTNDKGEVEGVKYDRVGVVLVNAVNEQQQQIETLQRTVLEQKQAIEDLKALLCSIKPDAAACKTN